MKRRVPGKDPKVRLGDGMPRPLFVFSMAQGRVEGFRV